MVYKSPYPYESKQRNELAHPRAGIAFRKRIVGDGGPARSEEGKRQQRNHESFAEHNGLISLYPYKIGLPVD